MTYRVCIIHSAVVELGVGGSAKHRKIGKLSLHSELNKKSGIKRVKALDSGNCTSTEDALVHLILWTLKRHQMVLTWFCFGKHIVDSYSFEKKAAKINYNRELKMEITNW